MCVKQVETCFLLTVLAGLTSCRLAAESPLPGFSPAVVSATLATSSPQPSHNPFDTRQLEVFEVLDYRTVARVPPRFCEPLSPELLATRKRLKHPADIAVSPDGQSVYVINRRCEALNIPPAKRYTQLCREGRDDYEERRFVYRIQQGQLEILTEASGLPPLSCVLGNDLEMDAQGRLLVTDVQQHRVYRLSAEGRLEPLIQDEVISELDRELPDDSRIDKVKGDPRELEGPRQLFLHGNTLYWALESKTRSLNPAAGYWQMKQYDVTNGSLSLIGEEARSLRYSPAYKLRLYRQLLPAHPEPSEALNEFQYLQQLETGSVSANVRSLEGSGLGSFKINARGDVYKTSGNAVYRIIPFEGISLLAGSSEAGFKDGQGSSARFNSLATELALDAQGNLYVIDEGNQAIRKITPEGGVATLYVQQ